VAEASPGTSNLLTFPAQFFPADCLLDGAACLVSGTAKLKVSR